MSTDEKWPMAAYERHAQVFYGMSFSELAHATQMGLRQRVDELIRQQTAPSGEQQSTELQDTSSSQHED